MDPSFQTLFLWRNSPTVVIGRHQNAWSECKVDEMEAAGIKLARRHSGGGAVFQDLGNTNFTFLSPANDFDKARNTGIIVRALAELGVSAQPSGRNDITVGARKVSGAAFKQSGDRSFHHGTLLINVDMGALQRYLNPHKAKLQSKGVKSVAARVVNLADINPSITHDSAVHAITQSFFREYGGECPVETLGTAFVEAEPKLQRYYEQLKEWEWRFGRSPHFSHNITTRFDWGLMDLHYDVLDGHIASVKLFSDALTPRLVELAEQALVGARYTRQDVAHAVRELRSAADLAGTEAATHVVQFADWLAREL